MPIPNSQITTAAVLLVAAEDTVADLLARLPSDRVQRAFTFVVFPAAAGRYWVLRWQAVEQIARTFGGNLLGRPVGELPGLPAPVPAVDVASNQQEARQLRDEQRPLRALVVLNGDTFLGLFVQVERSAADPGDDPFQPLASAAPEVETNGGGGSGDFTLGGDPIEALPQPSVPTPPAPPAPPPDERVINAWIGDHEKDQPLQVGESYELKFNVDSPRKGVVATAAFASEKLFADPALKEAELIVLLDSDDFEIVGDDQATLKVPRAGKSRNNATFAIVPRANGAGEVRAMFFANGRIFQKMKLTLQVGAVAPRTLVLNAEASGKTLGSVAAAPARGQEVDLVILKKDAGYEFILNSGGFKRAVVNLSEAQIADIAASARTALKDAVYVKDGGRFVYQSHDTNIPAAAHAQTLKGLMGAGFDLFEALFFAPGSGADANEMGRVLRQKSRANKLNIAIVAERFAFPWAMIYDRDYDLEQVNPEGFWGFKHVIEYTPEFRSASPVSFTPEIEAGAALEMAFVVNTTIDDELKRKGATVEVIKPQQAFLQQLAGVKVREYPNGSDLVRLLKDGTGTTQLIYFYCHAESGLPGEAGGVDASRVMLSDGWITLKDLKRAAPLSGDNMQSCPLVFLNACESAELSPYLYDGLVPYLIAKGARGVVGTEVNTPALFAAEFAKTFLERFTGGGQPLGELLLQMRREYLNGKNNVMGLVYALHSGAEVVVRRA
ncbi:MAG: CHAT domain-containing protein [Roseiflexaceae bacterium]|nr:CHAT domain-containing protein [Roseiflexaceae bacterium]